MKYLESVLNNAEALACATIHEIHESAKVKEKSKTEHEVGQPVLRGLDVRALEELSYSLKVIGQVHEHRRLHGLPAHSGLPKTCSSQA